MLMIYQGIWGFMVNLGKLIIKDVRLEGGVDDSSYGNVEVKVVHNFRRTRKEKTDNYVSSSLEPLQLGIGHY